MKYVMFKCTDDTGNSQLVPVIFPKELVHRFIAGAVRQVLCMKHHYENVEVVSAGDINLHTFSTTGRSETLRVEARPEDREVINTHDVTGGVLE